MLIEGCSGGGGRFDAGMLYYTPQIWCSDNTDASARLAIQYGTSLFYPPCATGAHVTASPNGLTGRRLPFAARAVTAFAGTFGYEFDLTACQDAELEEIRQASADFHRLHHLVDNGELHRLTRPGDYAVAWMNLAADGSEFLLSAVVPRVGADYSDPVIALRLAGLDETARYREERSGALFHGSVLMHAGFRLPMAETDGAAWRWHFIRE
jgi:alpha-galactosidase